MDRSTLPARLFAAWLILVAPLAAHAQDPGERAVMALQARFDDVRAECGDGSASFNCNGVLIRGIRNPSIPDFWNPTDEQLARDGVSFSYLRADVGNTAIAGNAGLIMRNLDAAPQQKLSVRCVFSVNAATSDRVKSCGTTQYPEACDTYGFDNEERWREHFDEVGPFKVCYFQPTAHWFQFSIDVRKNLLPLHRNMFNEVVIATWPHDIPEQLPIEALYFLVNELGSGLEDARLMQENFIKATGLFIPVVRVDLRREGQVFSYAPKDQSALYLEGLKAASDPAPAERS